MGKHLKRSYKTVKFGSLPKSYQTKLDQVFRHKTDDLPLRVKISTYVFTIWTKDLPIEYSNY